MKYKLLDVTIHANTGADAIQKAPIVDYNTGIKCVRVGDLSNDREFEEWGYSKVTDDIFKQYQLKKDDILVTRTAILGLNKLISSDLDAVYNNGLIRIIIDKTKVNPQFLYYCLQNKDFFKYINRIESETSVRPNMKINYLLDYEFECPDFDTQNKIISILLPINKKIKLNIKFNKLLNQLAHSIFNNFVENCNTRRFSVKDVILTANTGADAIQKAPIVDYDTGVKCIRVGDMSNDRDIYQWGYSKVTDDVFKQYQLKKDDILVTRTATLGLNRLITSDLNAVYNNGLIRLTVDKSKIFPLFLYRQFQTKDFFNFISRIESETSVRPNMKINYLLGYEFECPEINKQNELMELLMPLMNLIEVNKYQNNKLIQLRDTLLPKLMSGEIDVSNVKIENVLDYDSTDKLLFNED